MIQRLKLYSHSRIDNRDFTINVDLDISVICILYYLRSRKRLGEMEKLRTTIFLLASLVLVLKGTPGIVRAESTTVSRNTPWQEFGVFLDPIQKHTYARMLLL